MTAAATPDPSLDERRELVATACRVLAARGLADGVLGHVSLRVDGETMLVRCRGPRERGLAFTEPSDIRLVDLDGRPAGAGELDEHAVPNELPLHAEVLRQRRNVSAVVHAHPRPVVAADLAGIGIRPIVGAFDIPSTRLAAGGVPVYGRSVLIHNRELAAEMVTAMGERPVVVLRGHGLASAAAGVEQAVLQAIGITALAAMSLEIVAAGGWLTDIPDRDLAELPDLGGSFNVDVAWRHELARLAASCPPIDSRP